MALYDNTERRLDNTEQRLARVRERMARQRRYAIVFGLVFIFVLLALAVSQMRGDAPSAPQLVLTWPKHKVRQVIADGSSVVVRPGSPFEVTVTEPKRWSCQWSAPGVQVHGASTSWAPTEASTLKVRYRPTVTGWRRLTSWLRPAREMTLHGVVAKPAGLLRQTIVPPAGGVWVYPHVLARSPVAWDERALALLATPLLPGVNGASSPNVLPSPDKQLWTLVHSFDGADKATGQVVAIGDPGTYALLHSTNPEADLPRMARLMAQAETAPAASIKFVVRLDAKSPQGVVRVAFDGKRERAAWIKKAGQSQGTPLRWWDENTSNASNAS